MSAEELPSSASPESRPPINDRSVLEITAKELGLARRDPEVRKVLAEADEQEHRLEREGLIHP
jgi:hypothetical protein